MIGLILLLVVVGFSRKDKLNVILFNVDESVKGLSNHMRALRVARSHIWKKTSLFPDRKVRHLTYASHAAGVNGPSDFSLFTWKTYAPLSSIDIDLPIDRIKPMMQCIGKRHELRRYPLKIAVILAEKRWTTRWGIYKGLPTQESGGSVWGRIGRQSKGNF